MPGTECRPLVRRAQTCIHAEKGHCTVKKTPKPSLSYTPDPLRKPPSLAKLQVEDDSAPEGGTTTVDVLGFIGVPFIKRDPQRFL